MTLQEAGRGGVEWESALTGTGGTGVRPPKGYVKVQEGPTTLPRNLFRLLPDRLHSLPDTQLRSPGTPYLAGTPGTFREGSSS